MRRLYTTILCFAMLLVLSIAIIAHPGRTDGAGGHWDHSTGEYHYHHGYGPHDHYDIDGDGEIDCPYNFVDKESSSGSSSRTNEPNWISGHGNPGQNQQRTSSVEDHSSSQKIPDTTAARSTSSVNWFGLCILAFFFVLILLLIFRSIYLHAKNKKIDSITNCQFETVCNEQLLFSVEILTNILANEYNDLLMRQQNIANASPVIIKHPTEVVKVPNDTFVDDRGLPHKKFTNNSNIDSYIFHLSSTNVYHKSTCRHSRGGETNAWTLYKAIKRQPHWRSNQIRPCMHCNPLLPDLTWLEEYHDIQSSISAVDKVLCFSPLNHTCFKLHHTSYEDFIEKTSVLWDDHSQQAIDVSCLLNWKVVEPILKFYESRANQNGIIYANLTYLSHHHWNLEMKRKDQIREDVKNSLNKK